GFVVHTQVVTNSANDHWTRVDPNAHLEAHATRALQSRTKLRHRLLQGQGRAYGSLGRLLHGQWRPKKRHNAVARQLVHRAFIAMYFVDEQFIQVIHQGKERFLPELLTEGCIARDVGEQHRHLLALTLQPATIGKDFVSEVAG